MKTRLSIDPEIDAAAKHALRVIRRERKAARITSPAEYDKARALKSLRAALRELASAQAFLERSKCPGWLSGQLWEAVQKLQALHNAVEESK
jgi:hypothetical protein